MDIETRGLWLKRSCIGIALIGVSYVAAAIPGMGSVADLLFDAVLWPVDGQQKIDTQLTRLMIATLGATILLVAYLLYRVIDQFHATHTGFVERTILTAVIGWYVIESIFSLIVGAPLNLILNIGFAALFVVPIFLGRRKI